MQTLNKPAYIPPGRHPLARGCSKIINLKARDYLSPCGRGRRVAAGEGYLSNQSSVISNQKSCGHIFSDYWLLITDFCQPLTRPFGSTSPTRGEVIISLKNQFCFLNRLFCGDDARGRVLCKKGTLP